MKKIIKIIDSSDNLNVRKNRFKKIYSENEMFIRINPTNSGVFASLARMLSGMKFSCGCLYLNEKPNANKSNLFFSSNYFPLTTNCIAREKRERICEPKTEEFLNKLSELISKEQLEENDLEIFINIFFKTFRERILKGTFKRRFEIASSKIKETNDEESIELAYLLDQNSFLYGSCQWNLAKFDKLLKTIDDYNFNLAEKIEVNKNSFSRNISLISCYFRDLNNFLNLIGNSKKDSFDLSEGGNEIENYKVLINIFRNKNNSKAWKKKILPAQLIKNRIIDSNYCQSEDKDDINSGHFHAEMRCLENIFFLTRDSSKRGKLYCKENWESFVKAVQEKRFVISKLPCFHCHAFLISLSLLFEDDQFYSFLKKKINISNNDFSNDFDFKSLKIHEKTSYPKEDNLEFSISTQITSFLGSSSKVYAWISPSFFVFDEDDYSFAKSVNIVFKVLENYFHEEISGLSESGIFFVSETSEALNHQIKIKVESGIAKLGWIENQDNIEFLEDSLFEYRQQIIN